MVELYDDLSSKEMSRFVYLYPPVPSSILNQREKLLPALPIRANLAAADTDSASPFQLKSVVIPRKRSVCLTSTRG